MKKSLVVALLLLSSVFIFAQAPKARADPQVQECYGSTDGSLQTSVACDMGMNVTSGDLLYCGISAASATAQATVSDSVGTNLQARNSLFTTHGTVNYAVVQITGSIGSSGADNVTAYFTTASAAMIDCVEFNGFADVVITDASNQGTSTSGSVYSLSSASPLVPAVGTLIIVYAVASPCDGTGPAPGITYDPSFTPLSANSATQIVTAQNCKLLGSHFFELSQAGMYTVWQGGSSNATMSWTQFSAISQNTGAWVELGIEMQPASGAVTTSTVTTTSGAISSSIGSAVTDQRLSYGNIAKSYNTVAVQNAELLMLKQTGAQCIRVDLGYAAWLNGNTTQQNEATTIINSIKSSRCLILADAASESYRHGGGLAWAAFQTAWTTRVRTLAALYQPAYYIVIKEPGWYCPMITDCSTNPLVQQTSQWTSLAQNLTTTVLSVSPKTQVGVAISGDSLNQNPTLYNSFTAAMPTVAGLSFIGFDIYTASAQTATKTYLASNGSGGKAVWVAEWWSTASGAASSNDSQSLVNIYTFATYIGATFVIPFFTDNFASYSLSSVTNTAVISSTYNNPESRTPIFYTYQSLVSGIALSTTINGGGGGDVFTTSTTSGQSSTASTGAMASEIIAVLILGITGFYYFDSRRGARKRFARNLNRRPEGVNMKKKHWWWR